MHDNETFQIFYFFFVTSADMFSVAVQARSWEFDASLLGSNISDENIALFNQGAQIPGTYLVEVFVNGEWVDSREVLFFQQKDAEGMLTLQPCLNITQLSHYGIKTENYPALLGKVSDTRRECAVISAIPAFRADFNFGVQQLMLTVPQVALRPELKGIAPRELWDDGVSALILNYQVSVSRIELRRETSSVNESQYLQLEPGANFGPWRLRNLTIWQNSRAQSAHWQTAYTWLERGLNEINSRLTLGESFTPSDIFDSVPFRGMMLGSDDSMVPSSQSIFSPVVRGIANTQARVEVKQNGYTVYNATVAPGPFAINDFSAAGVGGDLQVTVYETDGSTQEFSVPYQTPAIALPSGRIVYNLMVGQYHPSESQVDTATVGQFTIMYGLPMNLTLYGGLQGAHHYQATTAGMGISLDAWGAVSLDAICASGQKKGQKSEISGHTRLRYSKSIEQTNTSFTLSTIIYGSSSDYNLSEVLNSYQRDNQSTYRAARRSSETTITLTQPLGRLGILSLRGSHSNGQGSTNSYSVGYGIGISGVSLSLNASQNYINNGDKWKNNLLANFMVSIPLDSWLGGNTRAMWQMSSPSLSSNTQQFGLSGQAYERQLQWNLNHRYYSGASGSDRDGSDVHLGWTGGYGQLNGNYSYSSTWRQAGLDYSGGIVITGTGLISGQTLNDAVVLVEAPGASGVRIAGWPGVKTDFRGYTTQSGLQPYRKNTISLDPVSLSDDVDLQQTDVVVVPTKGAVIPATFVTHVGGRVFITLTRPDGQTLPFGAMVTPVKQTSANIGIIDEGGQVYLSGLNNTGTLMVRWGTTRQEQCYADYRLPDTKSAAGLYLLKAVCR